MPKLTPAQLPDDYDAAAETAPLTLLDQALRWAKLGWNVFPLRPGQKEPLFPKAHPDDPKLQRSCKGACGKDGHGSHDGTQDPTRIRRWWTENPKANIGANLGDDKIVFDLDTHSDKYKDGVHWPVTRTHYSGKGGGSRHLVYRYAPGSISSQIKLGANVVGGGVDVRTGPGGFIVLPPSIHPDTGRAYWVGEENGGIPAGLSDDQVTAIYAEANATLSATARGAAKGMSAVNTPAKKTSPGGGNKGTLVSLLSDPPAEGGRNDWLARVAGHLAKMHSDKQDLYEFQVRDANSKLSQPLDEAELEKTMESIWLSETSNHEGGRPGESNGFVTGNGSAMFVQIQKNEDGETVYKQDRFALFDVRCNGVAVGVDDTRSYWLEFDAPGRRIERTVEAEVFGDERALKKLLASFGLTANLPTNVFPQGIPVSARLLQYIESQRPPQVELSEVLGWDTAKEYFVTLDGLIRPDGWEAAADAGVVADQSLKTRDLAPFHYGFQGEWEEAQAVLRRVLEFQDEETTAVFGAWWAACLLKPQFQARTALFPFMGIEAASESGKTNGFFALMVALNGNYRGQIAPTKPVLRDSASANRNGIVWADDLDSLEAYGEILRASTSNGTASKMDMDRHGIKNTQIVSPIMVSGEALGMSEQKALADRSIVIAPPSPTGRVNAAGESQWIDVKNLLEEFDDKEHLGLTVLAGHFAREALRREKEALSALREAGRKLKGRQGDKLSVLLAGAMLLDSLLDDPQAWTDQGMYAARVLAWSEASASDLPGDNTLTMKVLPWAIRYFGDHGELTKDTMGMMAGITTPVKVVQTGDPNELETPGVPEVWVSIPNLAMAWKKQAGFKTSERTETEAALSAQMDRVVMPGSGKAHRVGTSAVKMRRLLPEYARIVVERASRA